MKTKDSDPEFIATETVKQRLLLRPLSCIVKLQSERLAADDVPGTDLQVQLRDPITSDRHNEQACRHEITCIEAATQQPADNRKHDDGKNAGWRQNQSRSGRIVSEK